MPANENTSNDNFIMINEFPNQDEFEQHLSQLLLKCSHLQQELKIAQSENEDMKQKYKVSIQQVYSQIEKEK